MRTPRSCFAYLAMVLLCTAAIAAAQTPPAQRTVETKTAPPAGTGERCMMRCDKAEAACSSQVRQARQQCSKKAANNGRDPMLMRRDYSGYFCGYFDSTDYCARDPFSKDCRNRFSHRHGLCIDAINNNIAAQRYDCFVNERDAQNFCRDELRDCKQTCGS